MRCCLVGLLRRTLLSAGETALAAQFSPLSTARRVLAHPATIAKKVEAGIREVDWLQLESGAEPAEESEDSVVEDRQQLLLEAAVEQQHSGSEECFQYGHEHEPQRGAA